MVTPPTYSFHSDGNSSPLVRFSDKTTVYPAQKQYQIGKGSFGKVYLERSPKGKLLAIKVNRATAPYFANALKEKDRLNFLKNAPHVIPLISCKQVGPLELALVMPYKGQDAYKMFLQQKSAKPTPSQLDTTPSLLKDTSLGLPLTHLAVLGRHLLQTLDALDRKNIIHTDLKPENFSYNPETHETTVFDFGSAMSALETEAIKRMHLPITTLIYRAPEILMQHTDYDQKIDMWSLGCILFELFTKQQLITVVGKDSLDTQIGVLKQIIQLIGMPPNNWIEKMPSDLRKIIFKKEKNQWKLIDPNLSHTQSLRERIRQAALTSNGPSIRGKQLEHFIDLIEKMLCYNNRITPKQALAHPFFHRPIVVKVSDQNPRLKVIISDLIRRQNDPKKKDCIGYRLLRLKAKDFGKIKALPIVPHYKYHISVYNSGRRITSARVHLLSGRNIQIDQKKGKYFLKLSPT